MALRKKTVEDYISVRMKQLAEERDKAHDEHDKQWFNRCIQELDWVLQMRTKPTHNCFMNREQYSLKYVLKGYDALAKSPEEQRIYAVRDTTW
jgi:hypothetical protein